ncbi:MAG: hypothetical protein ACLSWY_06100 [Ruthenibacterium lactatiformans]
MCDRRGAIGLLMVQLARLSGAAKVILSEPVELRRSAGCPLERIWLSTRSGRTCPPVCGGCGQKRRGCGD